MNIDDHSSLRDKKTERLLALCEQAVRCKKCPLFEGRTKLVFGDGDPHAKVMIIGEAPGKNEDEQGVPFVGRAGEQLAQLLEISGLSRDEVYIANVIKCRPPNNRNPRVYEIEQCAPYLRQQTVIVRPKILVTLGNFATRFILKSDKGITELHGKPVSEGEFFIFPVYHPAAALYDRSKWAALEADFSLLKKMLQDDERS